MRIIMEINNSFLSKSEYYSLILREYYYENGYTFYKSNNFEDYDYYTDIKDYLYSDNIFTFTDSNNRLKALRPDVTLSILKQFNPSDNIFTLKTFTGLMDRLSYLKKYLR